MGGIKKPFNNKAIESIVILKAVLNIICFSRHLHHNLFKQSGEVRHGV